MASEHGLGGGLEKAGAACIRRRVPRVDPVRAEWARSEPELKPMRTSTRTTALLTATALLLAPSLACAATLVALTGDNAMKSKVGETVAVHVIPRPHANGNRIPHHSALTAFTWQNNVPSALRTADWRQRCTLPISNRHW